MLTTIVFFVVGLALGLLSLRLMSHWEARAVAEPSAEKGYRHHS